ncbi:hypothetical protein TREPR_2718 [Treponema primitia ZAS-2]|uniref:Uncharacterized protein n=1 Tax=Treponema primitia (strain ATCC BAA-887 / DSM 12427 / ZAS-2) TaxID=545694 RepID=F5YQL6_TREPZ|nr:hypothetical protein [Treponema primitia]AEF84640.1 hypothetical protein TREPR_2718 [Treponema primitia ZAS-2]
MKTIDEYMSDPRILNDPYMEDGPIKEIHAARLKLQDETAGMTVQEKCDYLNNKARETLARHGITPQFVNLAGQGRIQPKVTV